MTNMDPDMEQQTSILKRFFSLFVSKETHVDLHPMPMLKGLDKKTRMSEIENAIADLNARVATVSSSHYFSGKYIELVSTALQAASMEQWIEAKKRVWKAVFLVNRAIRSKRVDKLKMGLFAALILALLLLTLVHLAITQISDDYITIKKAASYYLPFMWMGALGGVTISIWGIVKHSIWLDFDEDYKLWYLFKPILGAVFGLVSILFIRSGFFILGINTGVKSQNADFADNGQAVDTDQLTGFVYDAEHMSALPVLYIIAFLAGFSERFFIRLTDRVMTAIFGGEKDQTVGLPDSDANKDYSLPMAGPKLPANGNPKPQETEEEKKSMTIT